MKIFDLTLKLNGLDIDKAEKVFQEKLALNGEALIQWQKEACFEIANWHFTHNPFYLLLLKRDGYHAMPECWENLPIIKKADLQVGLDKMIALPFRNQKVFKNNTSGSSGTPFYFARDLYCHAITWANYKFRFGQHGVDFNKSLQARFYGIPLSGWKFYKEKLKDLLAHRVRFPVFNLEDSVCAGYLEKFRHKPFYYLNGYTSSLVLFAKYCIAQGVVLNQICPSLKVCFTTSEMCSEVDRAILEKGFGIKVVNEYGAAELDLLAVENKEGKWVLNEENLFIEIVDENGKQVPAGVSGRVVVTALHNRAVPFIRYELGDVGMLSHEMLNGRRILQQLEGRTNDIAILPSGKKVPGLTFYYVTKSLLEKGGSMKEFVIRQELPERFVLEYVAGQPISEQEALSIQKLMDLYLEPGLQLSFHRVEKVNRTKVGKLRQFQSEVKAN